MNGVVTVPPETPATPQSVPGAPVPAEEAGADRRVRIIDAAYALLDEHGLDGLTVRAVLERTGLSRRAFYECFTGKDDLMLAVFASTIRWAADGFRDRFATLGTPMDRLRLIVVSIVGGSAEAEARTHDRRSAALSSEHLRLAESRPDDLQAAIRPLIALIAEQIEEGVADGSLLPCTPRLTARLIYNLASNTAHNEFLARSGESGMPERRRTTARAVWEFCRRAVAA